MIVLVTGGRNFTDGSFLFAEMDRLHAEFHFTMLVEGGQRKRINGMRRPVGGADFWAHEWAVMAGVLVKTEYAKWNDLSQPGARIKTNAAGKKYDAMAGMRRNQKMLDDFHPDLVVAFAGGNGTADMCERADAAGLQIIRVAP